MLASTMFIARVIGLLFLRQGWFIQPSRAVVTPKIAKWSTK